MHAGDSPGTRRVKTRQRRSSLARILTSCWQGHEVTEEDVLAVQRNNLCLASSTSPAVGMSEEESHPNRVAAIKDTVRKDVGGVPWKLRTLQHGWFVLPTVPQLPDMVIIRRMLDACVL